MKGCAAIWIFDLDNTLHDASSLIFPHINRAMTHYMMTHLGLTENAANTLRQSYWDQYGATLKGLMRHHGTNPRHFLHYTHQLPQIGNMLPKANGLRTSLIKLPGRKIVFTNAPMHYAESVLRQMRIRHLFDGVFSIESTGFQPKPSIAGFGRLLRRFGLNARRCIMVEDSLPALKTAKMLGMKTIFVNSGTQFPSYVDVRINSILALPRLATTF